MISTNLKKKFTKYKPYYTLGVFYVTGTFNGSHVYASSEFEARKMFHHTYNGQSIIRIIWRFKGDNLFFPKFLNTSLHLQ